MDILNIEVSYDGAENMYLVRVGNGLSTFTDYLDAKEFIDSKVRKSLWRYEDKLKQAANTAPTKQ